MAQRRRVTSPNEWIRRLDALCEIGRYACALKRLRAADLSALTRVDQHKALLLELECCGALDEPFAFDLRWRATQDALTDAEWAENGAVLALGVIADLSARGRYAEARPFLIYVVNRSAPSAVCLLLALQTLEAWPPTERPTVQPDWVDATHRLAAWYGQPFDPTQNFWHELEGLLPRILAHVETFLQTLTGRSASMVGDDREVARMNRFRAGRRAASPFARTLLASLVV